MAGSAYHETMDVTDYLARIDFDGPVSVDLATLSRLQRRHMTAVPFENLDIAVNLDPARPRGRGQGEDRGAGEEGEDRVTVDAEQNVRKIVDRRRGGWCFELNGAFALVLEQLGFSVMRLGAAVLLDGPSVVIDHLALEVMLDEPYLVDVGFGDSFIRPLAINRRGPQDGGVGQFEFIASPQGTTLTRHTDGVPTAQYRFKRVAHQMGDFAAVASSLQHDPNGHWRQKPFATRLLDGGPDRVTLTRDRLKFTRNGETEVQPVPSHEWNQTLKTWFGISW